MSRLRKWAFVLSVLGVLGALLATSAIWFVVSYPVDGVAHPLDRSEVMLVVTCFAAAALAVASTLTILRWGRLACVGALTSVAVGLLATTRWSDDPSFDRTAWIVATLPLLVSCGLLFTDAVQDHSHREPSPKEP